MKDYDRGQIYVAEATDEEMTGQIKVGFTTNDPSLRMKQLDVRCRLAYASDVMDGVAKIEKSAQRILALHGEHIRGEWFRATVENGVKAIALAIRQSNGLELALEGKLKPGSGRGRPLVDRSKSRLLTFRISNDLIAEVDAYCRRIGGDRGPQLARLIRLGLEKEVEHERRQRGRDGTQEQVQAKTG